MKSSASNEWRSQIVHNKEILPVYIFHLNEDCRSNEDQVDKQVRRMAAKGWSSKSRSRFHIATQRWLVNI